MYHMRRRDRELDAGGIGEILEKGRYIVLALCRNNEPYAVALSYGYDRDGNRLYMHCADEGLKLDFIRDNPTACGTVIIDGGYIEGKCSHAYESVVVRGGIRSLATASEKRDGMMAMMRHLEGDPGPIAQRAMGSEEAFAKLTVLVMDIAEATGKRGR